MSCRLNKHINQQSRYDLLYFASNRVALCSEVTHVIDCECYTVGKKNFLREVSIFDVVKCRVDTFYVYYENDEIQCSRTVDTQIGIHGLPVATHRQNGSYYTLDELMTCLHTIFNPATLFVAYKGGNIELNLLRSLKISSMNLELVGCEKYDVLLDKYGYSKRCCLEHLSNKYHCSRYEVIVFYTFMQDVINRGKLRNIYYSF